jgi:hypothetical protein
MSIALKSVSRNLGEARRHQHGVGYIISVRPFAAGDSRVAKLRDNTVYINSNHPDYQAFQNSKKEALRTRAGASRTTLT